MSANVEVVEQAYAAFARGDVGAVIMLLADDVTWSSPRTLPQGGAYRGKPAVAKFFEILGSAWDPLVASVERIGEIDDGTIVTVAHIDGRRRRDGRNTGYGATHVFRVRDGKIAQFREYTDLDGAVG